jgi:hypothetical protein
MSDGFSQLIGNYYFSPDTKVDILNNYFTFLEIALDTLNFLVLLLWDFNVPGLDWYSGLPSANCYYYARLKGEVICSSICLLGLSQYNYSEAGVNLLDLVFPNFADFTINSVLFSQTIIILLILLIALCLFNVPNMLLIFLSQDIQLVTIRCCMMPFLTTTGLLCIRNPPLMLLVTGSIPL